MNRTIILVACMMLSMMSAMAQTQATPDMKGQSGPFQKGTDFYYVTAVDAKEGVSLFAFNRIMSFFGASQRARVGDAMGTVGKQIGKIVREYVGK